MTFIFQTACPCGGSEEITRPHPVCFHSPVNLDLLIVEGTIKTQQLFNKKKRVAEGNTAKQRKAVCRPLQQHLHRVSIRVSSPTEEEVETTADSPAVEV